MSNSTPCRRRSYLTAFCALALIGFESASAQFAVITNQLDASLSIIDVERRQTLHDMTGVGATPAGIAACGNGRFIVASPEDAKITLIDATQGAILNQWTIGNGPLGIDCNDDTAVIAGWFDNRAHRLNLSNGEIQSFPVGRAPSGVLIDRDNNRVFIANRDDDSVWALDLHTGTPLAKITVGNAPFGLGYDNKRQWLFVVNVRSADVTIIDTVSYSAVASVDVGEWAYCIAIDSERGRAYVTNQDEDSVSVMSLETLEEITRYDVGLAPEGIAFRNERLWVVNWQEASVWVLDTRDGGVIDEIGVGRGARSYGRFLAD